MLKVTVDRATQLLEALATAAVRMDDTDRKAAWLELLSYRADELRRPVTDDSVVLALAAATVEMLAERQNVAAPHWTAEVGPAAHEVFLARRATEHGRQRLREQSPAPLRRRNLFAPAKYVQLM